NTPDKHIVRIANPRNASSASARGAEGTSTGIASTDVRSGDATASVIDAFQLHVGEISVQDFVVLLALDRATQATDLAQARTVTPSRAQQFHLGDGVAIAFRFHDSERAAEQEIRRDARANLVLA